MSVAFCFAFRIRKPTAGAIDEPLLQEGAALHLGDLDHPAGVNQIRHPSGRLGPVRRRKFLQCCPGALVQDDDPVLVAGQCRIDQLP